MPVARTDPARGDAVSRVETLAGQLERRGREVLAGEETGVALAGTTVELTEAALWPGVEALLERFDRGRALIEGAELSTLEQGEAEVAGVLSLRDVLRIRLAALEADGPADVASAAREGLLVLDTSLLAAPMTLADVATRRDDALAASPLGAASIWSQVPDVDPVEPYADDLLAARQAELQADAEAFFSVPPGLAPVLLLRPANDPPKAVRRRAASAGVVPHYVPPPPEALVHVFDGGAQVFALADEERWAVLLYLEDGDPAPRIDGPDAEVWSEGHHASALTVCGRLEIRLGAETVVLELPPMGN